MMTDNPFSVRENAHSGQVMKIMLGPNRARIGKVL